MRIWSLSCSFLALALVACGGAATPVRGGQLEHAMENCPSAVAGARTMARDLDRGIALDITSTTGDGEAAIRATAEIHARMGGPSPEHVEHTGEHGGPGTMGRCPIVHVGTQVLIAPIDGGVRVTMLALDPLQVDRIRAEVRDRLTALLVSTAR
jgi:hypothetical protein